MAGTPYRAMSTSRMLNCGRATGLPINGDFEDGYGKTERVPQPLSRHSGGSRGIGIEDSSGESDNPILNSRCS